MNDLIANGVTRRGILMSGAAAAILASLGIADPAAAATVQWGHPLDARNRPTSPYGPRGGSFHHGIDYGWFGNTRPTIRSVADGTVFDQGWHVNFGNFAEIRHANGWTSFYAHLVEPSLLRRGNTVKRGAAVGRMGNTGRSFGDHLHVELRTSPGVWNQTIDPYSYLHNAPLPGNQPSTPPPTSNNPEELTEMFIAVVSGNWYLVVPQGSGKPRAVVLGGDSNAGNAGLPVIHFNWQGSVDALRAAVEGV